MNDTDFDCVVTPRFKPTLEELAYAMDEAQVTLDECVAVLEEAIRETSPEIPATRIAIRTGLSVTRVRRLRGASYITQRRNQRQ